jgi:myo-inositol-1(or 4)-monophosphatase
MVFQDRLKFLNSVEEIGRLGAVEVMKFWQTLKPEQISEKARNDLVSAADRRAEAVILDAITERFPDHRILSEEAGWSGRDRSAPTWIVDPLDGTTNFVQCFPHFAVSIGVTIEDRIEAGVIIDPLKGDVFCAARGLGAFRNGEKIRVSDRCGLEGAVVATGFPFKAHRLLDSYLAIFKEVFLRCKAIRRPGSAALDLAYTACGIFDGFFEFELAPWDIAAGALIVEEAGGVITDMNGGPSYLESGNVVCGPAGVHKELVSLTRS